MLPITAFVRENMRRPDRGALALVVAVLVYTACVLAMPLSEAVRRAALARFHLTGWSFVQWVIFQPVPSMYNFENRWALSEVVPSPAAASDPGCADVPGGFVNHHAFSAILLRRAWIAHCVESATVTIDSTYRGTRLRTTWRIDRAAIGGGFRVRAATMGAAP
jgi:hypothetical protein